MHDTMWSNASPNGPDGTDRREEYVALERLARVGGDVLVRDLAFLYLGQAPERLLAGRAAIRNGDLTALARAAHALRSSSAQLGARGLANACDATEDAAENGDSARARMGFATIEAEYAAFSEWLSMRTGAVPPGERGRSANAGPVIAVVEDNADNRLLVDAILGDQFELVEYAAGVEAIAGMQARRPDLVLLDVSLPGMDGLEVLARLRGDPALGAVPVVAVTAHAMAGDRERYLSAGFDDYVAKPIVDEAALVRVIERLLVRDGVDSRHDGSSARGNP